MPTDLSSLRQQISEKFMFSPSDTAELVVSYAKDLGKKIIQTEQDFINFISDKIPKIDLDISQDSKLYLKNLNTLQKETDENKKQLEDSLKKKEEIKNRKETSLKERIAKIKEMEKQIKQMQKEKKSLEKQYQKDKKRFQKEEKENNKRILSLQKNLDWSMKEKKN
jgi:exonuclease VII large subunit